LSADTKQAAWGSAMPPACRALRPTRVEMQGSCRVKVTFLDEPFKEKPDTWDELYKLVSAMDENEKPKPEDFPRIELSRDPISFE